MTDHDSATAARLRLGPGDHGRPVTDEEFAEADYAEPWKYERVEGRLVVMSPEGKDHVGPRRALALSPRRSTRWAIRITSRMVKSEAWVRIPGGTDRIGDIGVYLGRGSTDPEDPRPRPRPDVRGRQPGARSTTATTSRSARTTTGSGSASTSSSTASRSR